MAQKAILAYILKDTMKEYRFEEICRRGEYREEEENYDLMRVFILRLGAEGENSENEVIRLLSNLFSTEKTAEEKKQILSEDFHIAMTEEILLKKGNRNEMVK